MAMQGQLAGCTPPGDEYVLAFKELQLSDSVQLLCNYILPDITVYVRL